MIYRTAALLRRLASRSVACLCAISLNGCTLIGYGIGLHEDRTASFPSAPSSGLAELKTGVQVRLFLRDGGLREGPYGGLAAPASLDYEARYAAARQAQGAAALPALGGPV